jgi:hypothetical protein
VAAVAPGLICIRVAREATMDRSRELVSTALRGLCSDDTAIPLIFPIRSSTLLRHIVQMTPIRTDDRRLRLTDQGTFNEALRDIATSWKYGTVRISDAAEVSSAGVDPHSDVNVLGIDVAPREAARKRKRGTSQDVDSGSDQSFGMYYHGPMVSSTH